MKCVLSCNDIVNTGSDSFVMIATSESVFYLPVPSADSGYTSTPQMLPLGPVGDITTLSYDPISQSTLITDSTSTLHKYVGHLS